MVRLDLNQAEVNVFKKTLEAGITSGSLKDADIKKAQDLNLKINEELKLPDQIPLTHYEKYKGFIRDGDRLSNDESMTKYGIPIEELRIEINDFVDEIMKGNLPIPRERLRSIPED